jgi:23S rRNA G2445 N2-methylase RlmL
VRIHVFLDEKMCTLYVDTSGESLFKRGKRDHVGEAPLKKNLAAGILRLAKWRPGVPLLDPMCGAGTFLSEAAEISLGRAAGRSRSFGFEKLARFNLSGGNIHSIALNAAFAAADQADMERVVTMPVLLSAARNELRKLDKPASEADFRTAQPTRDTA